MFLVRHGQSRGNVDKSVHTDMADHAIPLTQEGKNQALSAGKWLFDYLSPKIGQETYKNIRLWHSPYKRTRETASGLMEGGKNLFVNKVRECPLLCEQQFGLFDGIPDDKLSEAFPQEYDYYEKQMKFKGRFWAPMPLGESRFDVYKRCHQSFGSFQRDLDKHDVDNIIVVSHGTTNRAFTMAWLHKTPEWFDDEPRPDNCSIRLLEDSQDMGYIFKGFK